MDQVVGIRAWAFWLRNKDKIALPFPVSSIEWKKMYPNEADCPICHGANGRNVMAGDGTVYQCICLMPAWRDEQIRLRDVYQSKYEPIDFDDLDLRLSDKNTKGLTDAVKAAKHFVSHLDSWMTLSGPPGVGKTHILRAIATSIKPIGLFITATDFERKLFENMKSGTLDSFILNISQSAVLLFDDYGAEYDSDIVRAKIAAVFVARDHQAKDLPVVVTTNLDRKQLNAIPRVGSRLLNQDTGMFFSINMTDYRSREYRKTNLEGWDVKW